MSRPSKFVSSTTTSNGTRKIRVAVRAFGRLMLRRTVRAIVMQYHHRSDMKALLLVGGQGTRLRPLTIHAPKSIVPIFNRPFLNYQLDLIKQVPEIDEVILSLNYQPKRIEEVFGDGRSSGIKIRYVVEPTPLGTAGGVRYASEGVEDTLVVFNGDVLTQIDLGAIVAMHRERRAKATIVLTPVDSPSAYGLVETDPEGNIRRFIEKPKADEITC